MEENKELDKLDAFARKYIKEIPNEKPSIDFTKTLMENILEEKSSSVFVSKALISKKVWVLIFGLFAAAIFIPFKQMKETAIKLPELDFSFFDKIQMPNLLASFSVSNTVLYSLFFLGLMIMAQVIFLKGYFDKRFE